MIINELQQRIAKQFDLDKILFHTEIVVPKHVVKKNNRPIFGRGSAKFLGKSQKLRQAESLLYFHFKSEANAQEIFKPIDRPVWAIFLFYFDNYYTQNGAVNRTIPDLSNLLELPADELQNAGVIENDNLIYSFDCSRRLPGMANKLEIFLLEHCE